MAMREELLYEIFLKLKEAYGALYRYRYLEILATYRVEPRELRILRTNWGRLAMLASIGGYYDPPFKGYRSVTQVYPLSPTIFNVVVDAVIQHWVMVVVATEVGSEVLGVSIQDLAAFFMWTMESSSKPN